MTTPAQIAERWIEHDGYTTAYLEAGEGPPVVLVHGSGPGVSGRANWQGTLSSDMASRFRLLAPDVVGFGATQEPPGAVFDHPTRVEHIVRFLDALGLERVSLIGNSMGGAVALGLAHRHPERVQRMVLMGSVGISFPITAKLDAVWGYQPSLEAMEEMIRWFAVDTGLINPELVRLRHEASIAPGVMERYSAAFAAPRQRHIDAMALTESELAEVRVPTLLIHGAMDQIVPLEGTSLRMVRILPAADLVVLGRCGHWTQIERAREFQRYATQFLAGD